MSKQLTPNDLADVITRLLTNPAAAGELDTDAKFTAFMTDLASTVCDHVGGEVKHSADFTGDVCYVGIHGNESLPSDGGIWKDYDKEGELFPSPEDQ